MFYDHETVWQDPIATRWHVASTTTVDLDFMALAARQRSIEVERRRADAVPADVAIAAPESARLDGARLLGAPTSGSPYLLLVRSPYELS